MLPVEMKKYHAALNEVGEAEHTRLSLDDIAKIISYPGCMHARGDSHLIKILHSVNHMSKGNVYRIHHCLNLVTPTNTYIPLSLHSITLQASSISKILVHMHKVSAQGFRTHESCFRNVRIIFCLRMDTKYLVEIGRGFTYLAMHFSGDKGGMLCR